MTHPSEFDGPFERIFGALDTMNARQYWEQTNRLALLWVHALVGMCVGVNMSVNGTATVLERLFGSATVAGFATGLPAFIGGLVLASGLLRRPRYIRLEVVGLVLLALWDACMTATFMYSLTHHIAGVQPRSYPIFVYGGYLALLGVHLWSLSRIPRRSI